MWPGFLCNLSNDLVSNLLRNLLTNLLANQRGSAAMKFVRMLSLVEFSWGTLPFKFSNGCARLAPIESSLKIEMDIEYHSCGARLVVDSILLVGGQEWPVRLHLDEFKLIGRVLLVFKLGWHAPPGIYGMEVTFVRKPDLDFSISPVLSELPGVGAKLQSGLLQIIENEVVEPARVFIDVRQAFSNQVLQKQAGSKGQLQVLSHLYIRVIYLCVFYVYIWKTCIPRTCV